MASLVERWAQNGKHWDTVQKALVMDASQPRLDEPHLRNKIWEVKTGAFNSSEETALPNVCLAVAVRLYQLHLLGDAKKGSSAHTEAVSALERGLPMLIKAMQTPTKTQQCKETGLFPACVAAEAARKLLTLKEGKSARDSLNIVKGLRHRWQNIDTQEDPTTTAFTPTAQLLLSKGINKKQRVEALLGALEALLKQENAKQGITKQDVHQVSVVFSIQQEPDLGSSSKDGDPDADMPKEAKPTDTTSIKTKKGSEKPRKEAARTFKEGKGQNTVSKGSQEEHRDVVDVNRNAKIQDNKKDGKQLTLEAHQQRVQRLQDMFKDVPPGPLRVQKFVELTRMPLEEYNSEMDVALKAVLKTIGLSAPKTDVKKDKKDLSDTMYAVSWRDKLTQPQSKEEQEEQEKRGTFPGPQELWASLRQRHWPLLSRDQVLAAQSLGNLPVPVPAIPNTTGNATGDQQFGGDVTAEVTICPQYQNNSQPLLAVPSIESVMEHKLGAWIQQGIQSAALSAHAGHSNGNGNGLVAHPSQLGVDRRLLSQLLLLSWREQAQAVDYTQPALSLLDFMAIAQWSVQGWLSGLRGEAEPAALVDPTLLWRSELIEPQNGSWKQPDSVYMYNMQGASASPERTKAQRQSWQECAALVGLLTLRITHPHSTTATPHSAGPALQTPGSEAASQPDLECDDSASSSSKAGPSSPADSAGCKAESSSPGGRVKKAGGHKAQENGAAGAGAGLGAEASIGAGNQFGSSTPAQAELCDQEGGIRADLLMVFQLVRDVAHSGVGVQSLAMGQILFKMGVRNGRPSWATLGLPPKHLARLDKARQEAAEDGQIPEPADQLRKDLDILRGGENCVVGKIAAFNPSSEEVEPQIPEWQAEACQALKLLASHQLMLPMVSAGVGIYLTAQGMNLDEPLSQSPTQAEQHNTLVPMDLGDQTAVSEAVSKLGLLELMHLRSFVLAMVGQHASELQPVRAALLHHLRLNLIAGQCEVQVVTKTAQISAGSSAMMSKAAAKALKDSVQLSESSLEAMVQMRHALGHVCRTERDGQHLQGQPMLNGLSQFKNLEELHKERLSPAPHLGSLEAEVAILDTLASLSDLQACALPSLSAFAMVHPSIQHLHLMLQGVLACSGLLVQLLQSVQRLGKNLLHVSPEILQSTKEVKEVDRRYVEWRKTKNLFRIVSEAGWSSGSPPAPPPDMIVNAIRPHAERFCQVTWPYWQSTVEESRHYSTVHFQLEAVRVNLLHLSVKQNQTDMNEGLAGASAQKPSSKKGDPADNSPFLVTQLKAKEVALERFQHTLKTLQRTLISQPSFASQPSPSTWIHKALTGGMPESTGAEECEPDVNVIPRGELHEHLQNLEDLQIDTAQMAVRDILFLEAAVAGLTTHAHYCVFALLNHPLGCLSVPPVSAHKIILEAVDKRLQSQVLDSMLLDETAAKDRITAEEDKKKQQKKQQQEAIALKAKAAHEKKVNQNKEAEKDSATEKHGGEARSVSHTPHSTQQGVSLDELILGFLPPEDEQQEETSTTEFYWDAGLGQGAQDTSTADDKCGKDVAKHMRNMGLDPTDGLHTASYQSAVNDCGSEESSDFLGFLRVYLESNGVEVPAQVMGLPSEDAPMSISPEPHTLFEGTQGARASFSTTGGSLASALSQGRGQQSQSPVTGDGEGPGESCRAKKNRKKNGRKEAEPVQPWETAPGSASGPYATARSSSISEPLALNRGGSAEPYGPPPSGVNPTSSATSSATTWPQPRGAWATDGGPGGPSSSGGSRHGPTLGFASLLSSAPAGPRTVVSTPGPGPSSTGSELGPGRGLSLSQVWESSPASVPVPQMISQPGRMPIHLQAPQLNSSSVTGPPMGVSGPRGMPVQQLLPMPAYLGGPMTMQQPQHAQQLPHQQQQPEGSEVDDLLALCGEETPVHPPMPMARPYMPMPGPLGPGSLQGAWPVQLVQPLVRPVLPMQVPAVRSVPVSGPWGSLPVAPPLMVPVPLNPSVPTNIHGLVNRQGEYNCFLNVIIQCLWHCDSFKDIISREYSSRWEEVTKGSTVVGALLHLFQQLKEGEQEERVAGQHRLVIDPTDLRMALDALGKNISIGEMNDPTEVLDRLYECLALPHLHISINAPGVPGVRGTRVPVVQHCFALRVSDSVHCSLCQKVTHQMPEHSEYFQTMAVAWLLAGVEHGLGKRLTELMVVAREQEQKRCDPDVGGCNQFQTRSVLIHKLPKVFSLLLAWDEVVDTDMIRRALETVDLTFKMCDVYKTCAEVGHEDPLVDSATYHLCSMFCYYGQHYFAFIFNKTSQQWVMFDDTSVSVVGDWAAVLSKCERGRIQPCLLFYHVQQ